MANYLILNIIQHLADSHFFCWCTQDQPYLGWFLLVHIAVPPRAAREFDIGSKRRSPRPALSRCKTPSASSCCNTYDTYVYGKQI